MALENPTMEAGKRGRHNNSRRVAILGGNRIPFARSDGAYANASNQDMFTAALGGLIDRFSLRARSSAR